MSYSLILINLLNFPYQIQRKFDLIEIHTLRN